MARLFSVYVPVVVLAVLICDAIFVTSCFVLATYIVLEVDPTVFLLYDGGLSRIAVVIAAILLTMHFQDLYTVIQVRSRFVLVQQLCLVMGVAFLVQGLISYANAQLRLPLRIMLLGSVFSMVVLLFWRVLYSSFVVGLMGREQILLLGESPLLHDIAAHLAEHPELGQGIAGYVANPAAAPAEGHAWGKVLGPVSALREIVAAVKPDRIVVGISDRRSEMPLNELLELRLEGFLIEEVATAYERICQRVCIRELRPSQLIFSGELGPRSRNLFYQRLFHVLISLVCVALFLPVMLLVAMAIKLSSAGPVLYRQVRVGQDSAVFTVYKFRSMYENAEAATGIVWAAKDDPRITPLGRTLRKLRLDELPQFFNVLRGEMSIVGPRPERPEFVKTLSEQIPYYRQRHCVKPGITGWAQINHKYGDTSEDAIQKLEYDLYYIKNMSLAFDLYIMFNTVKAMVLSRGAQ